MPPLAAALMAGLLASPSPASPPDRTVPQFRAAAVTAKTEFEAGRDFLRGRPWLASFIYSRCRSSCPMIAGGLQRLQRLVDPRVRIVSFTVEPGYDTPRRLRKLAKRLGADPERWLFLRLPAPELDALMKDGFRLSASPQPGMEVAHSGMIVLVDAEGTIRGTYQGWDLNAQLQLKSEAERLLPGPVKAP